MSPRPGDFGERFWSKVLIGDGCWNWTAHRNENGYGVIGIGSRRVQGSRRAALAHRISFEMSNGPLLVDICVCHRCDNPSCVRPSHLFLGTHTDNMRDMRAKGRGNVFRRPAGSYTTRGEIHPLAKFTNESVRDVRAAHASGEGVKSIARRYGVTHQTIGSIVRRETWKHVEPPHVILRELAEAKAKPARRGQR